jgi:hypothetical protein
LAGDTPDEAIVLWHIIYPMMHTGATARTQGSPYATI